MIRITNGCETVTALVREDMPSAQRAIFRDLVSRPQTFAYPSGRELNFELRMREKTIAAAKALNDSGVSFATFDTSKCNPEFWIREPDGAFRLRPDVSPADAIRDIFINGPLYGFECATAIVIVFYKAVLDTIGETAYNMLFGNTYLFHWNVDRDLGLTTYPTTRYIPGDALYFDNPEFNPDTPEWQGENVIYLGGNQYYGHGLGIRRAEQIIGELNDRRRPGAIAPAFLMEQATRPNYILLSQASGGLPGTANPAGIPGDRNMLYRASIGSALYLLS